MKGSDFDSGVNHIDRLTQKQYLGKKWDAMDESEKKKHLVSSAPEFKVFLGNDYCFVVAKGKEVVGFLLAYSTLPFENKVYIRHIAIDPVLQGKGLGIDLYRKLIEKAKENNVREVVALINLDNPKSIRLHEKLGFDMKNRKQATLKL